MLVHRAHDRSCRLLDFFVAAPGKGLGPQRDRGDGCRRNSFRSGTATTQRFLIGHASCAVPGTVAGLAEAHRAYGTLPWDELLAPAVELARAGVVMTKAQALLHALLDSILRHTPESRVVYGRQRRLMAGDRLVATDLAGTLEAVAADGPDAVYRGDIGAAIAASCPGARRRDYAARPRVVSRDPPSAGDGRLPGPRVRVEPAAFVGRRADRRTGWRSSTASAPRAPPGSAAELARAGQVLREQTRARDARFTRELYRGGLARRLLSEELASPRRLRRAARGMRAPAERASVGGTTHISAVDAEGNAASLSSSTGAGSGVVVPGTGIHMNNMLGEYDLQPGRPRSCAGHPADEHDGALGRLARRRAAARAGQRGLGPAARRGHAGRRERRRPWPGRRARRSTGPRVHVDERTSTARAGTSPLRSTSSSGRLRRRALAAEKSLLRRCGGRRAHAGRHAGGGRRSSPRRSRHRRRALGA